MLGAGAKRASSCGIRPAFLGGRGGPGQSIRPIKRKGTASAPSRIARQQHNGTRNTSPPRRPPSRKPTANGNSVFSRLASRYAALLEARPIATKAVTSGIIAGAGDLTCQMLAAHFAHDHDGQEESREEDEASDGDENAPASSVFKTTVEAADIDWGRFLRFSALGAGFVAPSLHVWYGFLGRKFPGTALTTVVKRVALDQLAFSPVFLASFLSAVMLVDGKAAKIGSKLKADYGTILVGNWGYWIPAQLVNFRFIAPAYQVLFSNALAFLWNIYLSYQSNKVVKDKDSARTPPPDHIGPHMA